MPRAYCWLLLACICSGGLSLAQTPLSFDPAGASGKDPVLRYWRIVRGETHKVWGTSHDYTPVLLGQIRQESGGNERAVSRAGARGLTQFMPATFADMVRKYPEIGKDPFNASTSIAAQVRYMKEQYDAFALVQQPCQRMGYALSGYNGGRGYANRRLKAAKDPQDYFGDARLINPGILASNQKENEEYAERIVFKHQPRYTAYGLRLCIK